MQSSKLERHIEVLKVLVQNGPLKLEQIMCNFTIDCSDLKENLDFLVKQGLVEKRTKGKTQVVFAISQRGVSVLSYFGELKPAQCITEGSTMVVTPLIVFPEENNAI